jgi:hypothetical protein
MKRTKSYLSPMPFAQLIAVDAICPDGKVRKIRVGMADTFFSAPGRTRIAGVNICGNVWQPSTGKYAGEWVFTPVRDAKNYAALVAKLGPETMRDWWK